MTLRDQIKVVLEEVPETRNSDIALMIHVWKRYYSGKIGGWDPQDGDNLEGHVSLKDLFDLPREDHVKRIRADFNSKGFYWPTEPAIAEARGINEAQWREKLGYPEKKEKTIFLD